MSIWKRWFAKPPSVPLTMDATVTSREDGSPRRVQVSDAPKWGLSRSAPDSGAIRTALAAIAGGTSDSRSQFGEVVMVGAALWRRLLVQDTSLRNVGLQSLGISQGAADPLLAHGEQRAFRAEEVNRLAESLALAALAREFSGATLRPAADGERHTYWLTVPFEIADMPLTVVDNRRNVLLVVTEEGKVFWLDILSDYQVGCA